jgi:hypothetical protein
MLALKVESGPEENWVKNGGESESFSSSACASSGGSSSPFSLYSNHAGGLLNALSCLRCEVGGGLEEEKTLL